MSTDDFRVERDSMGELRVPANALWGAQTQRAVQNFPISGLAMPSGIHPRARPRQVGDRRREPGARRAGSRACVRDPEGRTRGRRRAPRCALPGRRVPDRLGHQQQHERERGDRAAREPLRRRDHGAPQRPRQSQPEQQRRVPDGAAPLARRLPSPSSSCPRSRNCPARSAASPPTSPRRSRPDARTSWTRCRSRFGQELGAWRTQIEDGVARINSCRPRLHALAQGGTAIGSGINAPPAFGARVAALLSRQTSLDLRPSRDFFAALAAQDTAVELSGHLRTVAVSLMKITNDLRWMNSGPLAGLGEIALPGAAARQQHHAGQGQSGRPGGGRHGRRPGDGQRRHDRRRRPVGQLSAQRHAARDRL